MTSPREVNESRREMLRGAARVAILGALGVVSGGLLLRRGNGPAGQDCGRSTPCSQCGALTRCKLPRALSTRRPKR